MLVSGGHLCPTTMFMDLNGHRTVIPITMAELAILVVTPTPEGSVRFDRHAMGAAGDGRHPIAVRTDARRHEPTGLAAIADASVRSEEHTSELQSLMRISYAVFCLKKKKKSLTSS